MRVMLGLGCDRNASLDTLLQAIEQALSSAGLTPHDVAGVASIDRKNDETALLQAARQHDWPLHFFPAETLAQVPVPNPSETVRKYMGTPAVAEAAALLASGGELILEKYKYQGTDGKNATVSIARMNDGK
ncbi:cobalamin biosynthesis protein [Candidatus Methylospira mobilis]|uniref:Cobalamin biosynthesis protein n=1 Tax=Candidatus Methylospira mobilis TaxID=1808979 RepID=A0A5Q0BHD3_9GAMM|nr:cobalamin biosynthesis protein [Candidatus Methylospira mobilis]QFY43285.1 cobalamin biosynthesis protein [Candidatus Methylospira mobilis]